MSVRYELIEKIPGVVIYVPKRSKTMNWQKPFIAKNGESVKPHWHHGRPLTSYFVLNFHFYGLVAGNFGKKICSTIEVIEKHLPDGRIFPLINVRNTPDADCLYNFQITSDGSGDFDIHPDVVERIAFIPRKNKLLRPPSPEQIASVSRENNRLRP